MISFVDSTDLNRLGVSIVEVEGNQQKPGGGFLYMLRMPRIGVPQQTSAVVDIGNMQRNLHMPKLDKEGKLQEYERDRPAVGRVDLHFITSKMALQWLTNIAPAYSEEFEGVLMMDQSGNSYSIVNGKSKGIVSVEISEIPGLIKSLKEANAETKKLNVDVANLKKLLADLDKINLVELKSELKWLRVTMIENYDDLPKEIETFSTELAEISKQLEKINSKLDPSFGMCIEKLLKLISGEENPGKGNNNIAGAPGNANPTGSGGDNGTKQEGAAPPANGTPESGTIPENGETADKPKTKASNLDNSELEKRISPAEKNLPESQVNMFGDFFNPDDASKKNILISQNSIVVTAPSEESLSRVMQIIRGLDRRPRGIKLKVRVCEFSERARKQLGMDITSDSIATTFTEFLGKNNRYETDSIEGYTRDNGLNFSASLDTLIRDGEITLLAEPDLSTIENFEAVYSAIDRVPYIQSEEYLNNNTTKVTDNVSYLNIGVTLRFKPIISGDDLLTIAVLPEVTTLVNDTTIGGTSFNPPRYLRRSLKTIVNVRDGEPFVLAGMISEKDQIDVDKVPLLGDMPIVKKLFRKRSIVKERSEIYIIVIPEILDE
ncbi:MAG: type II and III secretion system protein [Planctomycetales bacterium]|nr:MAG: type II and III secretion system protein [Planctomycetales bacterium]